MDIAALGDTTSTGSITEYDRDGRIAAFGGRAISADRTGLTSVVSDYVDGEYNLFVSTAARRCPALVPTELALSIHEAWLITLRADMLKRLVSGASLCA